jgi:pyridoxal phosphate enzyme (YggS family)
VTEPAALLARLTAVRERIANAASRVGRDPSSITLVAISKTFPAQDVQRIAAAGQTHFGENKVQEGLAKIQALGRAPLTWHLVGHVQSNKAKKAARVFDVIHSVDSVMLLRSLDEGAAAAQRAIRVMIQVDLAGESSKHGAKPEDLPGILREAENCQATKLVGLMLLPPLGPDAEASRPHFTALRRLRDDLVTGGTPPGMLAELSMGMSHDFEVAIEEGATVVRVGSAIFGERPPRPPTG